tara:strand:- start:963 stop:1499 length:537 start_codon:yes stop_codon:yes gene_type:complete
MSATENLEITIKDCKSSVTPWDEKQWEAQVQFPGHTNFVKTYIKRQVSDEPIKDGVYQAEAIKNQKGYYEIQSIVPIGEYVANVDGNPAKPIISNNSGISQNSYVIIRQNANRSANILLGKLQQRADYLFEIDEPNRHIDEYLEHLTDVNTRIILKKIKDGTWQEEFTKPAEDVSKEE